MSFDETHHPRERTGKFAEKSNSAPGSVLTAPSAAVEYDEPKHVAARDLLPGDMVDLSGVWKYSGDPDDPMNSFAAFAEFELGVVEDVESYSGHTVVYLENGPANAFIADGVKLPVTGREYNGDEILTPARGIEEPDSAELAAVNAQMFAREGIRELSDSAASTTARDLLHHLPVDDPSFTRTGIDEYRSLRAVANDAAGFDNSDETAVRELHEELAAIYASPYLGRGTGRAQRLNMLFTWGLHGGDND